MDTEQSRKRKLIAKLQYCSLLERYFVVRSLFLCFAFIAFLYLLSNRISIAQSAFRPALAITSFSIHSIRFYPNNIQSPSPLKTEDRILFPDHVLLMVSIRKLNADEIDCVYDKTPLKNSITNNIDEIRRLKRNVLGVGEYNQFQSLVSCPLPPANFSAVVNLEMRRGKAITNLFDNRTVHSWEMVAYAATLDANTAVVFVKGLNLRPGRESDHTQFSCHFGLRNWERESRDGRYVFTTKAITAAQEVVRCLLPRSFQMKPSLAQGIRITIGMSPHVHSRRHDRVLVPSVAKISNFKPEEEKMRSHGKYELCACTMVWNQAPALREWIMYHSWLGVERWFIYDNNSEDSIKEVIQELELEDYNVTRHIWPWIKTQEAGFSHCALRARDECKWLGFMDVDEFFYFPSPNNHNMKSREVVFPGQNSLKTLVSKFSSSFTTVGEIRTACHSFGPSGLSSLPSQGITSGYTCRLQSPERHKSILRPEALDITLLNAVHHFHLRKGFTYLNLPQSTAVINHYKYQVWEAFSAKFFRRVATYVADWQENQNEGSKDRAPGLGTEATEPPNWRLQFCEVWDTGLRDFVLANLADPATGLLPWERNFLQQT